jgi:S-formylglutathione hydrolase FrmB
MQYPFLEAWKTLAIVRVSFFSNQLHRTVPFTAVLPNDGEAYPGQVPDFVTGKMKTLYLLHGYTGDENDYLSNSLVRELSAKYKIAVIMPAGENCFYVDSGDDVLGYGRYIGEELVEYTGRIFRLSDKREDTFIAGLSMGGYGACATAWSITTPSLKYVLSPAPISSSGSLTRAGNRLRMKYQIPPCREDCSAISGHSRSAVWIRETW